MKGNLKTQFEKDGKLFERKLNPNRSYISKDGKGLKLHGRSLLLIRNVGHLMTNPSIILSNGNEVPEGCLLYTSPSPRDGLLSRMPSSA